jgi:hypothetical protein
MSPPRLAVVGRVNKGKSSIIATLAEDDRIPVSPEPGTTTEVVEVPVTVDGRLLFTLLDTPGFEQAPEALAWLRSSGPAADERAQRLRAFLDAYADSDEFPEECALLQPIVDGAAVIYVVDGTRPYRENYASEMEILRWSGRPSMALINRIGDGDHAEAWRKALDQYFKVVRDFDAHSARFEERIALLDAFRVLSPADEGVFRVAIEGLKAERVRRQTVVADIVAGLLADCLSLQLRVGADEQREPAKLEAEFHDALRERERKARREVEALYLHRRLQFEWADDLQRPVFGEDLFAKRTWTDLGLTPVQILGLYSGSGAVAGGAVDAAVGGASFMTGTLIGGAIGLGLGLAQLERRFARATQAGEWVDRAKRAFRSGPELVVGPHSHPNFPFVLLQRALLHHRAVQDQAHGRGAGFDAPMPTPIAGDAAEVPMDREDRQRIHRWAKKLRKDPTAPNARTGVRAWVLDRISRPVDHASAPI